MRIGPLARLCGVSPDTLRHYERLKLLCAAGRTPGGYRFYAPEAAARVRIIQAALSLGFTLAELSRVFGMRDAGKPPCHAVRALAEEKLVAIEQRLKDTCLRAGLRAVLKSWDVRLESTPAGARAGLLDALVSGEVDLDLPPRISIRKRINRRNPK
jgi:DNA-binding transcriptional MerR regulator